MSGDTHVGGGRDAQAARAELEREDLARDDPRERAPRRGEEEDVNTDKGDAGFLGRDVVHDDVAGAVLARRRGAEDGDDELADAHAHGAPEEQGPAPELVNGPEAREGGHDVDARRDHLDREGVGDARVLEVPIRSVRHCMGQIPGKLLRGASYCVP